MFDDMGSEMLDGVNVLPRRLPNLYWMLTTRRLMAAATSRLPGEDEMSPKAPFGLTRLRRSSGQLVYSSHRLVRRLGGWGATTQMVALVVATLAASIILLSTLHMRALVDAAHQDRTEFVTRQARNIERLVESADGDVKSPLSLEPIQRFAEDVGLIGGLSNFVFVGANGTILAHSNSRRVGGSYLDSSLAKVLASGRAALDEERDTVSGRISLHVAAPVRYRGAVVGAIVASFPLEALDDELAASQQAGSVSALIVALIFVPTTALVVARFQRTLERMAITDGLSGLYQNSYFRKRLAQEIKRSARYGHQFSLIMFDIDDFKAYNDTRGHLVGDEAIQLVSQALRSAIRAVDFPARYGGEEFAAILPHTGPEQAYLVSERIREGVRDATVGRGCPLTVSLGLASCPSDASSADDLIHCADLALYYAKLIGKNRSVLYSAMPKRWPPALVKESN